MRNCYHKILEDVTEGEIEGEEFGYSKIGSLVALYSNCPNNTPPMYHHLSTNWSPIFPRSSRA
ncbi:phosphoribosyltransferase-like protein [Marinobacter shengliensis]